MQTRINQQRRRVQYRCGLIPALIVVAGGLFAGPASAAVITFTATRDNTITDFDSGGSPYTNTNFGAFPDISAGYLTNGTQKSIVGFTLNNPALATLSVVNSVTLRLYLEATDFGTSIGTLPSFNNNVFAISAANGDWVEGTGAAFDTNAPDSTWNHKKTATLWAGSAGLSTAVTDYDSTMLASITFNRASLPTLGSAVDFVFSGTPAQLTTLIQNWEVSMPGLLLQTSTPDPSPTTNIDRMRWYTREASGGSFAPQLIVDFTPVPEPSACLLLIVSGGFLCRKFRR